MDNQLKTIAALYFALAGVSLFLLLFIPIHYQTMGLMSSIEFPVKEGQPNPTKMVGPMLAIMKIVYVISGIVALLFVAIALATGVCIYRKTNRLLCIIGAAICCISVPLGTALGIWALLVLFDERTMAEFEEI
ncbi:MAG: hypothetical protein ACR2NU_12810 [Aeoliella sp.]